MLTLLKKKCLQMLFGLKSFKYFEFYYILMKTSLLTKLRNIPAIDYSAFGILNFTDYFKTNFILGYEEIFSGDDFDPTSFYALDSLENRKYADEQEKQLFS